MALRRNGTWGKLLQPVSPKVFFDQFYDKKPLYISGRPEKFAQLFDLKAYYACLGSTGEIKAGMLDRDGLHREITLQPRDADNVYDSGMTVCVGSVQESHEPLAQFITGIKREITVAGEFRINCYYSPDKSGFGTHFDNRAVWILQIEGEKEWRYSAEPAIQAPTQMTVPGPEVVGAPWEEIPRPDEDKFLLAHLKAGDVLYLPAGTWHRARGVGRTLALTMYVSSASPFQLLQQVLEPILCRDSEWRRELPFAETEALASGEVPPRLRRVLAERLADLKAKISELDEEALIAAWYERLRPRGLESGPVQAANQRPVRRGDRIELVAGALLFRGSSSGEEVVARLYAPAQHSRRPTRRDATGEIFLSGDALPLLRQLFRTPSFVARDAMHWRSEGYTWEEIKTVLEELLKVGAVRFAPRTIARSSRKARAEA